MTLQELKELNKSSTSIPLQVSSKNIHAGAYIRQGIIHDMITDYDSSYALVMGVCPTCGEITLCAPSLVDPKLMFYNCQKDPEHAFCRRTE